MISGNFQFQQNTSCRHTDRDKNVAPLTLWSAVVIRQNPSKWITPASHRVGTRQAECNCAKWVYSTWEWLERLFCTHQCPNRWSTLYNKKRLVNFNSPLNQDPFGYEIGDCSEIGISVYAAKPATRSYPELAWFPRWGYPVGIWKPTWAAGVATSAATWQVGEHPGPPKRDETR
jgi:hypothetical protein